jgi:hypothetical protein
MFIPLYLFHMHVTKYMYTQTQMTFKDYFKTVSIDLFYMAATPHLQMCVHMHFYMCNICIFLMLYFKLWINTNLICRVSFAYNKDYGLSYRLTVHVSNFLAEQIFDTFWNQV